MDLHIDHKNQQYTVRPMDPSMGFWGEFWDRIISGFFPLPWSQDVPTSFPSATNVAARDLR